MPNTGEYLLIGAVAALVTFATTPLVVRVARRFGWVVEPDTRHELEEAMKLIGAGNDKVPVPEMRWILTQLGDKMREDEADELIKELAEDNFIELAKIRELSFPSEDEPKKKKGKDAKGKSAKGKK